MVLEAELTEMSRDAFIFGIGGFRTAKLDEASVREADEFREVIEHEGAAQWRRQGRDEQAVVSPCDHTGNRGRSITPKPIGDEPLAVEKIALPVACRGGKVNLSDLF